MKYTLFALLLVPAALFAEPELTGSPQELIRYLQAIPKTVSITGRAEKKVPADRAVIQLKVETESKSMADALTQNRILREQIGAELLAAGFETNQIKAAEFSSTPESGWFSDKVKRHKVENTMKVTAVDEDAFRVVAELVDSHKEVSYGETEFELADKQGMEQQILAEACRRAVAKKALYEAELGVVLTPVRFHDGQVALSQPRLRRVQSKMMTYATSEDAPLSYAPAQFDEMTFTANITVEYRLEVTP